MNGLHLEGPYLAQPKVPYKLRSYWKSEDLCCAIAVGVFESSEIAQAAADSLIRIAANSGVLAADFSNGRAMPIDLSGVIFFRNNDGLDLDFDLPGDLSWLLQHGYRFQLTGRPAIVATRVGHTKTVTNN